MGARLASLTGVSDLSSGVLQKIVAGVDSSGDFDKHLSSRVFSSWRRAIQGKQAGMGAGEFYTERIGI